MQSKALTLTAVFALALLAGCSDPPPSGDLVSVGAALPAEGTSMNEYQAATYPVDDQPTLCAPDEVPIDQAHCTAANTNITVHFMSLPEPDGNGYSVVLVGSAGEKNIGSLIESNGMYELAYTIDEDYSSMYDVIEVRMGDFLYATAPSAAGGQAFVLAPGTMGVTATGSFKGKTLDVDVQGLPEGSTYVGRLYVMAEDGNLTSTAQFDILAGANHYEDEKMNIGDYAEFHIHVGNSKINLFKATLG